jgi:NDP-sugar pyrophosphorylase family protein
MQVVILGAGRGSRMTELLGSTIPKCLIPIAGNPLIFYPMKSLVASGLGFKGNCN